MGLVNGLACRVGWHWLKLDAWLWVIRLVCWWMAYRNLLILRYRARLVSVSIARCWDNGIGLGGGISRAAILGVVITATK